MLTLLFIAYVGSTVIKTIDLGANSLTVMIDGDQLAMTMDMGARRIVFQVRANGESRPEGLRRGGVVGEGCELPPQEMGSLGERCKLYQQGLGWSPVQIDFCTIDHWRLRFSLVYMVKSGDN